MKKWLLLLVMLSTLALAQGGDLKARLEEGFSALNAGRYGEAASIFEAVVAKDYKNFRAHLGLGLSYYKAGRLDEALFEFRQLTRLYPDRFEGWYNLGLVLVDQGRFKEAADAFAMAVQVGEKAKLDRASLRPAYLGFAQAAMRQGQFDQAANLLEKFYKDHGVDPVVDLLLARALHRSGRDEDAVPYLYEVLAKKPGDREATLLLADVYQGLKLTDRAFKVLDGALAEAKDPKAKAAFLFKKAALLVANGQPADQALALVKEAVRLDPEEWRYRYEEGRLLLLLHRPEEALKVFKEAYKLAPEAPEVLAGMAAAYDALGQADKAYRAAKLALGLMEGKKPVELRYLLGKNAYLSGRSKEAVEVLAGVAKEKGDDPEVWTWYGLALYAQEDYGQAAAALERAAELDPSPEVLFDLGAAYLAARRFSDAERVFSRVVEAKPNWAEAWYNLGWALKALGRDAEAKRAWKKAIQLGYKPANG